MPPGAPNLFREELGRNLNRVFPPQRGGFEIPTVLDGVVRLSHDFPGTRPYIDTSIYDNVGAADVVSILAAITPPEGYIWLIDEMSIFTSDTATREMRVAIRYVIGTGTWVVTVHRQTTQASASPVAYPVGRRLIVPPGGIVDLSISALTAGANIRWTFAYFQLPAGQFCPKT